MASPRPLSFSTVRVLQALADGIPFGFDVMTATGLPSGTVYPILARLERQELVRSRWEASELARREKRPARRYYELSAAGRRALAASLEHYQTLGGRLAPEWQPGGRDG